MGLLDSIEKLITEHGSAAILRERIALANDKHAQLERKAATLEDENRLLKTHVEVAKSDNERLSAEIGALKAQALGSQISGQSSRLESVREKILVLLAEQDGLADHQIAEAIGVGLQVAAFHLQELQSASMVRRTLRVGQRVTPWHVSHEGRRYLVSNRLVA